MERKINCKIFTPDGPVYQGEADLAVLPSLDGETGILFNHAPMITGIGAGLVRLKEGQSADYLYIEGGFAEISNNNLSIFPLQAVRKDDLSVSQIENEISTKTEEVKKAGYNADLRAKITDELYALKIKLKSAKKGKQS